VLIAQVWRSELLAVDASDALAADPGAGIIMSPKDKSYLDYTPKQVQYNMH
jgi:hypothetical protein